MIRLQTYRSLKLPFDSIIYRCNDEVHIVPDSLGCGGDSNSTAASTTNLNHLAKPTPDVIPSSSATGGDSGTPPSGSLDSTKYYGGGDRDEGEIPRLKSCGAYTFAAALLESSDEEEGEECASSRKEKGEGLRKRFSSDNMLDDSDSCSEGRQLSSAGSPSLQVVSGEMYTVTSCHCVCIYTHIYYYTPVGLIPT